MAKNVRRSVRSCKLSYAFVAFLITSIMLLELLSTFRNDTQVLDSEIAAIQRQLAEAQKELRDLEQEATAMMSPSAVHVYAMRELGMAQVHLAGAVHLGVGRSDGTATASLVRVNSER